MGPGRYARGGGAAHVRFKVVIGAPTDVGTRLLKSASAYQNLDVEIGPWGSEFVSAEAATGADAIVLYLDTEHDDVRDLCRRVRQQTDSPLLILAEDDRCEVAVTALTAGADDCVPASTYSREVWARVRGQLRRAHEYARTRKPASRIEIGDITIDTGRHEAFVGGAALDLTPKEFALLAYVARQAGRVIPRNELLTTVWRHTDGMKSRTLDVHVGRLRAKFEGIAGRECPIVTVPGVGYKLAEAG